jgi:hypothetical protein
VLKNHVMDSNEFPKKLTLVIKENFDYYVGNKEKQLDFLEKVAKNTGIDAKKIKILTISKGSVHFHLEFENVSDGYQVVSHADSLSEIGINIETSYLESNMPSLSFNPCYNKFYQRGSTYWDSYVNDSHDRGGEPYFCPVGWTRFSFKTDDVNQFEGKAVVYVESIFNFWLNLNSNTPSTLNKYVYSRNNRVEGIKGRALYCSPSIKLISQLSEPKKGTDDKYYKVLFQCRVDPNKVTKGKVKRIEGFTDPNYPMKDAPIEWFLNDENNSFIFPYAIMIRAFVSNQNPL